ncbi:MAG: hypothetical protein HY270_19225 [Deltaproteobacteria bacterium]|nr:hypothetical protein [Deltaproteobacteria bacterium]
MSAQRFILPLLLGCVMGLSLSQKPSLAQDAPDAAVVNPVDPRDTLKELDEKAIAKQKELMQARMRNDQPAVDRLSKEFEEIQKLRLPLVRKVQNYR